MRTWWLVLLLGCGDNLAGAVDGARSGSRLRLYWYEFADGVRHWRAHEGIEFRGTRNASTEIYYDSALDKPCSPEVWLDGVTRCMPDVEINSEKRYLDAACTMRVTFFPHKYSLVSDYDPKCGVNRLWHVYPVVETIPGGATYRIAADGKCYRSSDSASQLGVLGAELPADTFVPLETTTSHDGRQRIQVRYRESADGMRLPIGLLDELLGAARIENGLAVPTEAVGIRSVFADETCQQPTVSAGFGCTRPQVAHDGDAFYRIGERAPVVYDVVDTTCTRLVPNEDFYVLDGSPVPLADMSTVPEVVAGKRIAIQRANTGWRPVRTLQLFDTRLASECTMVAFPDDVHRCMPKHTIGKRVPFTYSDPQCQTDLDVIEPVSERFVVEDNTSFGGLLTILEVGDRYESSVYKRIDVMCVPATENLYAVRTVDWSELASAELVSD